MGRANTRARCSESPSFLHKRKKKIILLFRVGRGLFKGGQVIPTPTCEPITPAPDPTLPPSSAVDMYSQGQLQTKTQTNWRSSTQKYVGESTNPLYYVTDGNQSPCHLAEHENTALRMKALKPYVAVKTEAIMIHMDFARGLGASSFSQEDPFVSLQQWQLEAVPLPLLTIFSH